MEESRRTNGFCLNTVSFFDFGLEPLFSLSLAARKNFLLLSCLFFAPEEEECRRRDCFSLSYSQIFEGKSIFSLFSRKRKRKRKSWKSHIRRRRLIVFNFERRKQTVSVALEQEMARRRNQPNNLGLDGHCSRDCPDKPVGAKSAKAANNTTAYASTSDGKGGILLIPAKLTNHGGWIIDYGAAKHVCNNRSYYSKYEDCGGYVYTGDGSRLLAKGVGDIRLRMFDGSVQTISGVRHMPSMRWNLISLSKLDSQGFNYSTKNGVMKVSRGNIMIMKASRCMSLYRLHGNVIDGGSTGLNSKTGASLGGAAAMQNGSILGGATRPRMIHKWVPVTTMSKKLDTPDHRHR